MSGAVLKQSGSFYRQVALLGTGLIGGSLGIRLRERQLVGKITGYDRDPASLALARERGAVDEVAGSPQEAVRGAQLVILAVPVLSTVELLRQIIPALDSGVTISDVGSTKQKIIEEVRPLLPEGACFIGGHPMAGSEEAGIRAADPALLENAIYLLAPVAGTPADKIALFSDLIQATGAQPVIMEAAEHDRIVTMVSHLPHLAAAALVICASHGGDLELIRTLAAGGFRDTTRVALGNPEIWRDICLSNQENLAGALKLFGKIIDDLSRSVAGAEAPALENFLQQARDFRRLIPYRGRSILPELYELTVLVPDTPGVIGKLATLLGEEGINISSIEILHVRELEGGSIRLGFRAPDQQQAALSLLQSRGYRVHKRN